MEFNAGDEGEPQRGVNRTLTTIWNQFIADMVETSPNERGASSPPYILLSPEERKAVTIDLYRDNRLTHIFRDFMWRRADRAQWCQNFDRLFPQKGPVTGRRVQNYKNTAYYPMWVRFGERTTDETFIAARKEMWNRVKTLYWLPATESDRIWSTRVNPKFQKTNGKSPSKSAPHVLVYGHGRPR